MLMPLQEELEALSPRMLAGIDRQVVAAMRWLAGSSDPRTPLRLLSPPGTFAPPAPLPESDGSNPTEFDFLNPAQGGVSQEFSLLNSSTAFGPEVGKAWLTLMNAPTDHPHGLGTIRTDLNWWPEGAALSKASAEKMAEWLRQNLRFMWAYLWGFPNQSDWIRIFDGTGRTAPVYSPESQPDHEAVSFPFARFILQSIPGLLLLDRFKIPTPWVAEVKELESSTKMSLLSQTSVDEDWGPCPDPYRGWSGGRSSKVRLAVPHAKVGNIKLDFFETLLLARRALKCMPVRPEGWIARPKMAKAIAPNSVLAYTRSGYMVVASPENLGAYDRLHPSFPAHHRERPWVSIHRLDGTLVGNATATELIRAALPPRDNQRVPTAVRRAFAELSPSIGLSTPHDIPLWPIDSVRWTSAGKALMEGRIRSHVVWSPAVPEQAVQKWMKQTIGTSYRKFHKWAAPLELDPVSMPNIVPEPLKAVWGRGPLTEPWTWEDAAVTPDDWQIHSSGTNFLQAKKIFFRTTMRKMVTLPAREWRPLVRFWEDFQKLKARWMAMSHWARITYPFLREGFTLSGIEGMDGYLLTVAGEESGFSLSAGDELARTPKGRNSTATLVALSNIHREGRRFVAEAHVNYEIGVEGKSGWFGEVIFNNARKEWMADFMRTRAPKLVNRKYVWSSVFIPEAISSMERIVAEWQLSASRESTRDAQMWRERLREIERIPSLRGSRAVRPRVGKALQDSTWRSTLRVLRNVA